MIWVRLIFFIFTDHLRVANSLSKIGFAKIVAKTSWGILRGLQSLSQLFYNDNSKVYHQAGYIFLMNIFSEINKKNFENYFLEFY